MANKRYTLKDDDKFINSIGKRDIAWFLNTFDEIKRYVKRFVIRNDEERFNRFLDKCYKSVKYQRDGVKSAVSGLLDSLFDDIDRKTLLRKGSAEKLFQDYKERIKIKYDIDGYTPSEVYENIDAFSDSLLIRYPNLITSSEKKWNSKKDGMNFNFESRGYNVNGNMYLDGKELVISVKVPPVLKPYRKEAIGGIEKTLKEILPRLSKSE